jgi:hypothetical protein
MMKTYFFKSVADLLRVIKPPLLILACFPLAFPALSFGIDCRVINGLWQEPSPESKDMPDGYGYSSAAIFFKICPKVHSVWMFAGDYEKTFTFAKCQFDRSSQAFRFSEPIGRTNINQIIVEFDTDGGLLMKSIPKALKNRRTFYKIEDDLDMIVGPNTKREDAKLIRCK